MVKWHDNGKLNDIVTAGPEDDLSYAFGAICPTTP